jgi:hypothetical protein
VSGATTSVALTPSGQTNINVPAIAGGSAAGVAVIGLLIFLAVLCRRRRNRKPVEYGVVPVNDPGAASEMSTLGRSSNYGPAPAELSEPSHGYDRAVLRNEYDSPTSPLAF